MVRMVGGGVSGLLFPRAEGKFWETLPDSKRQLLSVLQAGGYLSEVACEASSPRRCDAILEYTSNILSLGTICNELLRGVSLTSDATIRSQNKY